MSEASIEGEQRAAGVEEVCEAARIQQAFQRGWKVEQEKLTSPNASTVLLLPYNSLKNSEPLC